MIKAIQDRYPFVVCVIYSGDNVPRDELVRNARRKFGLDISPDTIHVVELSLRWWVDYKFPRLTMLIQSIGSVVLAAQAIRRFAPDVFFETVGFAFTYPFVDMVAPDVPIVSYTHYPTISSDMQTVVSSREAGVNNDPAIAASELLSSLKSAYYAVFARMYAFSGSFASVIMTNSSWTQGHIVKLFERPRTTSVVYPPCNTSAMLELPPEGRALFIVSLAQFRPEKNHHLQLEAFAEFLREHPDRAAPDSDKKPTAEQLLDDAAERPGSPLCRYPALVMIGGARNVEDEARAEALRQAADKLGIGRQVHVVVNAPWGQVLRWLGRSKLGIHTMRDEHFGIGVVEMMAAGLLTIAHDSAGPQMDIVTPAVRCTNGRLDVPSEDAARTFLESAAGRGKAATTAATPEFPVGMVAQTAGEFAQMMAFGLAATGSVEAAMRCAARTAASTRFSEAAFCASFYARFDPVIRWLDRQRAAGNGATS
ncbi:asparagine-linked glycosylation protein [Coemansia biformis]|uniref:GDP-Man:Man(3)GlcNAc(2)-PP-Dol alpha-1,2-mannosyltransferase n=1 Tax=Coemansia biformis TaxID=1286918 RepID=A0A9W7Y8N4_9FUNG|nr:asparagine-linked glycosylation protein [Coemansia biformis]